MTAVILVVDDDPVQRRLLENMVVRFGYDVRTAADGDSAAAFLLGPDAEQIDAVVLDLVMPNLDGMGLLARLREHGRRVPVIVQTAHGGIDSVVSAMRAGAADFVVKPVGPERLQVSLRNVLAGAALEDELARMKRARSGTLTFRHIVTKSPLMATLLQAAEKAAKSTIPVLLEGESGTGKEMIARAIHGSGERRSKPFVAVNCGALPENLVESILFGHEKGSFTGATEKQTGKFVEAAGGTLFLDEVGDLPLAAQVKLLRAIQENEVEPLGGRKPIKTDVRIISATHRDLIAEVKQGRFREDLFYRLHVFPLTVPPLRRRLEDVPDLVRVFLARFSAEEGRRIGAITAQAVALLARYSWPGNVRQLENAVFRAVVMAETDCIGAAEFPQIVAALARGDHGDEAQTEAPLVPTSPDEVMTISPGTWPGEPAQGIDAAVPASHLVMTDADGQVRPLEELELEIIRFAITHYDRQMSEVARRLKIGRSTLYRKLDPLGIDTDENPAETVSGTVAAG